MNRRKDSVVNWEEVKRQLHLSDEVVKIAEELKLKPQEIIEHSNKEKTNPNFSPETWIRDLYKKSTTKTKTKRGGKPQTTEKPQPDNITKSKDKGKKEQVPAKKTAKSATKTNLKREANLRLAEIKDLLLDIEDEDDEIPDRMWDNVEWLVENRFEHLLHEMMDDDETSEVEYAVLSFLLEEIGYRFSVWYERKDRKGKTKVQNMEFIPTAMIFAAVIPAGDSNAIPTELPEMVERVTRDKILRRACRLNNEPTINFDTRLYHVDHPEWQQESAVRHYLKGFFQFTMLSGSSLPPLSSEYQKRSQFRMLNNTDDEAMEAYHMILRVMCITLTAGEEFSLELEDQLFGEGEEEGDNPTATRAWEEMEDLIAQELEKAGIHHVPQVFIYPRLVELWEVPETALMMYRNITLRIELENALERLYVNNEESNGQPPQLFVSQHGDGEIEEIRVAAYASQEQPAFFTYVWEVDRQLDDPEEVANLIIEIASELQANLVVVNGLLEKDYCPDCGEPIFRGPQPSYLHDHGEEFLN